MKNLSAYIRDETRLTTRLLGALATTMSDALYPLASLSQIKSTPSSEDGIPAYLEDDLRAYGCKFIQEAGVLLKQFVL